MRVSSLTGSEKLWSALWIVLVLAVVFASVADAMRVFSFSNTFFSLSSLDLVFLISAIILISITFTLGPLARLNQKFENYYAFRRSFGLAGFSLLLLHLMYLLFFVHNILSLELSPEFSANQNLFALILGLIGVAVFYVMGITSGDRAVNSIGFEWWKKIHTAGYIGLAFLLLHIFVLESSKNNFLGSAPIVLFAFLLGLLAMVFRAVLPLLKKG